MAGWFAELGKQAAGGAVQGGMGMGFSRLASRYDRRMAKKSQMQAMGIQMAGEREMMNYQQDKELEMLDKSPGATIEGMKKAGLNPALMYGMGGGGGITTGHGGSPSISTGTGEKDTGRQETGMGMQLATLQAQIELMKAQTNKTNVEATKMAGADTENVKAQTASLAQGVQNQKAQEVLTRIQTEVEQVKATVSRQTVNEQMKAWEQLVKKNDEEIKALQLSNTLSEEQMNDKILMLKTQIAETVLRNELTKAQTDKTRTDTGQIVRMNDALIKNWADHVAIEWVNAETGVRNAGTAEYQQQNSGNKSIDDLIMIAVGMIIKGQVPTRTTIRGFKK